MFVIGISGRMGSGKSTVARRFGELGALVVDADAIAHEVLDDDAKAEVVARFGAGILAADGRIDRARLARLVFGQGPDHATALADLEAIVHPRVHRRIGAALASARAQDTATDGVEIRAVLDVPLLVKSGWDRESDAIVAVECDDRVRRERLARRGVDAVQQAARDAAWESQRPPAGGAATPGAGSKRAFTVDTSRDLSYTFAQVDEIWRSLPRS